MNTEESKAQSTINIAVIEDDPLRIVGLRSILEPLPALHLNAMSTSQIATDWTVNLVLVGNCAGIKFAETMARLKAVRPDLPIVVTGSATSEDVVLNVLAYGAKGYVDEQSIGQLAQAIQTVHEGLVWAPRHVISTFIERSRAILERRRSCGAADSTLTSREKQILRMLVDGRSNKEIALPLGLAERTVKAHIGNMMRKLGARNRIALSVQAVSQSILPQGSEVLWKYR